MPVWERGVWNLTDILYISAFVIITAVILGLGLKDRVLFKMGVRNFVRHRAHSALVVGGLLIGTAIIGGAMVTGDSIDNFIVKNVYESLDRVDITVKANGSMYFNQSIYTELSDSIGVKKYTDGIAPMIVSSISAENPVSKRFEPTMTLYGFEPTLDKTFGSFTTHDGKNTYGEELSSVDAFLNSVAADILDAAPGQSINITYMPKGSPFPQQAQITVKNIVKYDGKGRYGLKPAVFIRLDHAQKMLNHPDEINLIRISCTGDAKSGVTYSDDAVNAINETIRSSSIPDAKNLVVRADKKDGIEQSRRIGEMITSFITIFGSFSIIAGVILIINIFTMLAEERKSELGMARAVGMTRTDLMKMFLFEGTTYTLAASFFGTLAGLAIAYGLMWGVNNVFTTFISGGIPFYFEWSSLVITFCIGSVITFLTIIVASWRVTNINIVRAIRDIEEPIKRRASTGMAVLGGFVFGISLAVFVIGYEDFIVRYTAPCIALMGLSLMLHRFTTAKWAYSSGGFGIIVWTLYSITTYFESSRDNDNVQYLFIIAGIFIVLAAVIIVMFNSNLVVGAVSGTVGRTRFMRPIVKTAVSHPLNKRFRTGMTVSMFSLVIFTIVMVSVFTGIFSINIDDLMREQGGGYQIMGQTNMPVNDLGNASIYNPTINKTIPIISQTLKNSISSYEQISIVIPTPQMKVNGKRLTGSGMGGGGMSGGSNGGGMTMYAVDEHFIRHATFTFSNYSKDYASPADVWNAVMAQNSTYVVYGGMSFSGSSAVEIGTTVVITTAYGDKNFTVIGILDCLLSGIFTTKNNLASQFLRIAPYSGNYLFLFKVKPGIDVQTVADALKWDFRALGMNAVNIRALIETVFDMINSIFQLFQVFLGLGLVVGIAGLGIITIRSVVERKREIGIMRAIGFERRKILASYVTEILFIATLAVVIGVAVGVIVTYEIFAIMVKDVDVTFSIPWFNIGIVVMITYAASLACTILPAYRASRIQPAEALRINE